LNQALICFLYRFLIFSETIVLKRSPAAPRPGFHVSSKGQNVLTLRPTAFSGYKVL
jgi:hypothetical protein